MSLDDIIERLRKAKKNPIVNKFKDITPKQLVKYMA